MPTGRKVGIATHNRILNGSAQSGYLQSKHFRGPVQQLVGYVLRVSLSVSEVCMRVLATIFSLTCNYYGRPM